MPSNYLENTAKEDASLREKTGSSCLGEINVRFRIAPSLENTTLGKQASPCPAPHCTGARMWYPEMGTDLKLWMWEPQGRSGSGAGMESSIVPTHYAVISQDCTTCCLRAADCIVLAPPRVSEEPLATTEHSVSFLRPLQGPHSHSFPGEASISGCYGLSAPKMLP